MTLRWALAVTLVLALVQGWAFSSRAEELTADERAFVEEHPDAALVSLLESNSLDLQHRPERGGIVGSWETTSEYVVVKRGGIEMINRQFRVHSPAYSTAEFEVVVWHAGGGKTRLDEGDLDWVEINANSKGVYTVDRKVEYAVIPRITVGDRVRVRERFEISGMHGIPPMSYARRADVPVHAAELVVRHYDDHELVYDWLGAQELVERIQEERSQSKGRTTTTFRVGRLDPVRREPWAYGEIERGLQWVGHFAHSGSTEDDFAAGPDWAATGTAYLHRIADQLRPTPAVEADARAVVAGATTPAESIGLLFEHVQRQCRYLGLFDGLGGLIPEPASSTHERGYGDCKGLSVLLIAMLRAVDIDAWPALVRTASAGPYATAVPNMAQFNHFIVWADDGAGGMWLDPVYDFCPAGLVPSGDAAWPVLLLRPGQVGLAEIDADSSPPGEFVRSLRGDLDAAGYARLEVEESATANAALSRRLQFDGESDDAVAAELVSSLGGSQLKASVATALLEADPAWHQPWRVLLTLDATRLASAAGDELYLPLGCLRLSCPALDAEDRSSPLYLTRWPSETTEWWLEVPPGLGLEEIAEERAAPGMQWSLRVWVEGGVLRLRRSIRFQLRVIGPDEALELAAVLEEIAAAEDRYLQLAPVSR